MSFTGSAGFAWDAPSESAIFASMVFLQLHCKDASGGILFLSTAAPAFLQFFLSQAGTEGIQEATFCPGWEEAH